MVEYSRTFRNASVHSPQSIMHLVITMWLILQHSPSSHISFTRIEEIFRNNVSVRGFVNMLAILFSDWMWEIWRSPHSINSRRKWWWISMCLLHPWNWGSRVNAIAPQLSLLRLNGRSGSSPSSRISIWCQRMWHVACERATYSASRVERAIVPCFFALQATAPLT